VQRLSIPEDDNLKSSLLKVPGMHLNYRDREDDSGNRDIFAANNDTR
jgi:hypothetical protein